MILKSISSSSGFASLSTESAVLFCLLIPHFNAHGKMNGGAGYIKDEVCPLIKYFNYANLPKYLKEISDRTSVKWFEYDSRHWIHSINFISKHQRLTESRVGQDLLPTYSRPTPDLPYDKVEEEVEGNSEIAPQWEKAPCLSPLQKLWNEVCPNLQKVKTPTKGRKRKEELRLKTFPYDDWVQVFKVINKSSFCCGENNRGWRASFDWAISKDEVAAKALEGGYQDKAKKSHIDKINESLRDFR